MVTTKSAHGASRKSPRSISSPFLLNSFSLMYIDEYTHEYTCTDSLYRSFIHHIYDRDVRAIFISFFLAPFRLTNIRRPYDNALLLSFGFYYSSLGSTEGCRFRLLTNEAWTPPIFFYLILVKDFNFSQELTLFRALFFFL